MPMALNIPGTLTFLRALLTPTSLLPHASVSDFNALSAPIPSLLPSIAHPHPHAYSALKPPSTSSSSSSRSSTSPTPSPASLSPASPTASQAQPKISGIVLDKDNCFTLPHSLSIFPAYRNTFSSLAARYPGRVLIVSNTIGTPSFPSSSPGYKTFVQNINTDLVDNASDSEKEDIRVAVLEHASKKPAVQCANEVTSWFAARGVPKEEILVIGDRLATDVLLAKRIGCWSLFIEQGPAGNGVFRVLEGGLLKAMRGVGWSAGLVGGEKRDR